MRIPASNLPPFERREEMLRRLIDLSLQNREERIEEDGGEEKEAILAGYGQNDLDEDIARSAGIYGLEELITKEMQGNFEDPEYYAGTSGYVIDSQIYQAKERQKALDEYLNDSMKKPIDVKISVENIDANFLNSAMIDTYHNIDLLPLSPTNEKIAEDSLNPYVICTKEQDKNNAPCIMIAPTQSFGSQEPDNNIDTYKQFKDNWNNKNAADCLSGPLWLSGDEDKDSILHINFDEERSFTFNPNSPLEFIATFNF